MATAMMAASSAPPFGGAVATASGYLALLKEDDPALKLHALEKLLGCVDTAWHEIAEALVDLERLAEEGDGESGMGSGNSDPRLRRLAAAVASRVFYALEEPTQALRLALEAGEEYFSPLSPTPYEQKLVAAALDAYILQKQQQADATGGSAGASSSSKAAPEAAAGGGGGSTTDGVPIQQLRQMIRRLISTSCEAGDVEHAIGIALEAREMDVLPGILAGSGLPATTYALRAAERLESKLVRVQAMGIVAESLQARFDAPGTIAAGTGGGGGGAASDTKVAVAYDLVLVYQHLRQPERVAAVLTTLLDSPNEDGHGLLALQICFDLMDSGHSDFTKALAAHLFPTTAGESEGAAAAAAAPEAAADGTSAAADAADADADGKPVLWKQVRRVLVGGFASELALSFLHKHSNADRLVMEQLRKGLEERSSRSSILHNAGVVSHSYLHAGTTNDSYLRDNLDWMKKASNWAKFSATASLGVIHSMHITEAMNLLEPYLPAVDSTPSPTGGFAEGGSLYALGIVHAQPTSCASKRAEAGAYIRSHLRNSHANEVLSHGAALGVGLTAMGAADWTVVQELKELLDTDSAVAGEAAGMAIGLVLLGTGAGNAHNSLTMNAEELNELVLELKNYARETQHEKIIRGIAMGLALMNYGQEEHADAAIEEMRSDRDPVMRYGAQYAIALAYCGTGSNRAIRILLHTAVSDVSDDVRMAAVIGLAFVLCRTPERVPQLVKLLLESFNPHVRYASCMAVGLAMAGTGDPESIALLEPMLDDMTDYVRQGALMGTAMIYMQQSDSCNNRKIKSFRERIAAIVTEKHQTTLTKMGAILATGIIDAGGRNCSLTLGSRNGFTKMSSAAGLALWLQHWHWYPMMQMFSLVLTPTCTIGLNKEFKYPKKFEIQCNAKPSAFAYPKKLEEKKEEAKKRVETVTLSTTAKEKARLARKRAKMGEKDSESKEPEASDAATKSDGDGDGDAMEIDKVVVEAKAADDTDTAKPKKKREPEPTSFRVGNPSRITLAQSKVCVFDLAQRYRPVRFNETPMGVMILTDSKPDDEEEDLGTVKSPSLEPEGELAPPEPFEWTPPFPLSGPVDSGASVSSAEP